MKDALNKFFTWLSTALIPRNNENLKIGLLCIVTAATFWFFNALNDQYTTKINYPIHFSFPDSSYVALQDPPDHISIDVTGGGWSLLRKTFWFNINPIEVSLDRPAQTPFILGSSLYGQISEQLNEIQLNYVATDTLALHIDSRAEAKLDVELDSGAIDLRDGYRIVSPITLSTDTVHLEGPASILKEIPAKLVLKIPDDQLDEDYDDELRVPDFGSSFVHFTPERVRISFKVAHFVSQELYLPFERVDFPKNKEVQLSDSLVTLKFQINDKWAGKYPLDSIQVQADWKSLQKNDSMLTPKIVGLPAALQQVDMNVKPIKVLSIE